MFPVKEMPSAKLLLSAYTTFVATAMLIRTVMNEIHNLISQIVPKALRDKIMSKFGLLTANISSSMCIVVSESDGYANNEVFEAAEVYLRTMIDPSVKQLRVSKTRRDKALFVTVDKGETIVDNFNGILLQWKLVSVENQRPHAEGEAFLGNESVERRSFELRFDKKYQQQVLSSYLPFVVERSKAIKEDSKVIKLYSLGYCGERDGGPWGSVNLEHPSTFDTLAMEPTMKKEVIEDLDRFVRRRDFYKRVGKAWKRGYLLYGPPGTGKSSLIAAMANYLKFHIYDVELTSLQSNTELRRLLVSMKNRSMLVIEDIDCSIDLENRGGYNSSKMKQLTLSGLLNFVDGLWSSCGDEKIIVFTTNHKEKLDPALLRPGRMDMHIHMSYCTFSSFKILVSNYLGIKSHPTFEEIEKLLDEVEATPAELAEELMKSEEVDSVMEKVCQFLHNKKYEPANEDEGKKEGIEYEVRGSQEWDVEPSKNIAMNNLYPSFM